MSAQIVTSPARNRPRWGGWLAALLAVPALAGGWWLLGERGLDFDRIGNLNAPGEVVVFFGDSLTQGYGVEQAEAFPELVTREFGLAALNAGVSGDTTASGLARLERDVLVHTPRLTVVELGGNDFLRRVPVAETLKNLDTIVARLIAAETMVVLLEVNVGLLGDPYLAGYREVAGRHGALLVPDILQGILTDPGLRIDAVHPNAKGHQRIAARVGPAVRDLLRAADRRRGNSRQAGSRGRFPVARVPEHRVDSKYGTPAPGPA